MLKMKVIYIINCIIIFNNIIFNNNNNNNNNNNKNYLVFIWIGHGSNVAEKTNSFKYALVYINK